MLLFDRAYLYIAFDVYIKTRRYKYVKVKSSDDYMYICERSTEAAARINSMSTEMSGESI